MLYQIHQHFDNGEVKVFGQGEYNNRDGTSKMHALIDEIVKNNPLPKDAQWAMCTEKAPCFVGVKEVVG